MNVVLESTCGRCLGPPVTFPEGKDQGCLFMTATPCQVTATLFPPRLAAELQQLTARLSGATWPHPVFRGLSFGRCEAGSPAGTLTLWDPPPVNKRGEGDGISRT